MKRPCLPAVLAVLSLCAPLAAQRSERAIGNDLAFARELAARYQYVDLAESVLASVKAERLSERQKESLALVQCQVYTEAAKREGDPTKRLVVFDKAAVSYRDFFAAFPFSELLAEAERSYLGLVNNYGRALEMALADAVGDQAASLGETIRKVLEDGLERTSKLKDSYERQGLGQAEKLEKWRLMLDRAQMLITLGNVTADPEFLFSQAQRELEKMAQEAGETSGPGLNAFLALAKLNLLRGRYDDAFAFAEYVCNLAVPKEPGADWKEVPFEARAERFKLVELAMPDLLESRVAAGRMAEASAWSLYFYNAWKREGFEISPFGYLALLSAARTLLDAGGFVGGSMTQGNLRWFESDEEMSKAGFSARDSRSALDLALQTAQDVNDANKGNTLQIRAQKLIADVISRPGVVVSPDVLFQAAQGEYNTENFPAALGALKNVMRSLETRDEATRREYMPKVLFYLGQTFTRLERPLEAAIAFRDGATTWAGDPEYQSQLARGFYREIGNVRRAAPGEKLIEEQFLLGEKLVVEAAAGEGGGGAEQVKWRQAERAYERKNYENARQTYLTVGPAADEHEKAIVKAALCLYQADDKDKAAQEFRAYLEVFVPNPNNAITGARKLAARDEARAQATYYLGKIAFDAQDYATAIAVLSGYETQFKEQADYAPRALYMVVLAQLGERDLAAARKAMAALLAAFPGNTFTGRAAYSLYLQLKAEQEKAAKGGAAEAAAATALKREMAENLRISNETTAEPIYGNLRAESTLWLELGDWVAAEETLRVTLKAFEKNASSAGDMEAYVKPDLGEALLGQKRVPEAFAVLDPLIPKEDSDTRKPASKTARNWCRSLTGWIEEEGTQMVEVPGVGGDFKLAVGMLGKLIDSEKQTNEAWSCPWYGLKFEQIYALLQWSKVDSSQRDGAKRVLDDIVSQLGDPDLKDVAGKCGDEALRKRYLWLRSQLR